MLAEHFSVCRFVYLKKWLVVRARCATQKQVTNIVVGMTTFGEQLTRQLISSVLFVDPPIKAGTDWEPTT